MKKQQSAVSNQQSVAITQAVELMGDLQRTRADFENFRKNAEADKQRYGETIKITTIAKLLPIIDNIERATAHLPADLAENAWALGVLAMYENLTHELAKIGVSKINAVPGTKFDPAFHDAVQMNEEADGATEVIEAELQPGYLLDGEPIRHAMVRVTRQ